MKIRWWVWACISMTTWAALGVWAAPEADSAADPTRVKRQMFTNMMRAMGKTIRRGVSSVGHTVDHHIVPGVRYAAERLSEDVVPAIGEKIMDVTNHVVLSTAEGMQSTANVVKTRILPVIEDRLVDVGNAAVPVINKGIDAVGAGLRAGWNAVSKTASNGLHRLTNRVLGEKRHNRVKNIASSLSGGLAYGINSLADALESSGKDNMKQYRDENNRYEFPTINDIPLTNNNKPDNDDQNKDYHTNDDYYTNHADYPNDSDYDFPYRPVQYEQPLRNLNEAFGKLMGNTVYTISKHFFGTNLTDAVAPVAKRVSQTVGQTLPAVSFGDGRIVIDLPGGGDEAEDKRTEEFRGCTTPKGENGQCRDLSDCPNLILDLSNLRKSVCFKSLFVPGVCCPGTDANVNSIDSPSSSSNVLVPSHHRPITMPPRPQTERPPPLTRPPVETTTFQPATAVHHVDTWHQPTTNNFQCGVPKVPTFRIVGGDESRQGQWPWMAAIWLHGPKKTEFWCGGSLISKQYVLTAAHCTKDSKGKTFDARQLSVKLGDQHIFTTSDDHISNPQTFSVLEINPHPDFKSHGFYNDVALIKLERAVDFTEFILPVCLPPHEMTRQPIDQLVGETPTVIGWGSTFYGGHESSALREAKLPVWKNSDCDDAYFQPITEIFLCAGFAEGGRDACQGDSGGPLQLFKDGNWVQIGIVSFGNRCAEPGYPGVYTRITEFLPWINSNIV